MLAMANTQERHSQTQLYTLAHRYRHREREMFIHLNVFFHIIYIGLQTVCEDTPERGAEREKKTDRYIYMDVHTEGIL